MSIDPMRRPLTQRQCLHALAAIAICLVVLLAVCRQMWGGPSQVAKYRLTWGVQENVLVPCSVSENVDPYTGSKPSLVFANSVVCFKTEYRKMAKHFNTLPDVLKLYADRPHDFGLIKLFNWKLSGPLIGTADQKRLDALLEEERAIKP